MDYTKLAVRYHADLLRTTLGAVAILYILYRHSALLSIDLILRLSVFERIGIFLVLSFTLGKVSEAIGSIVSKFVARALRFTISNLCNGVTDPDMAEVAKFIKQKLANANLNYGPDYTKNTSGKDFNTADIRIYIHSEPSLKEHYDSSMNSSAFWFTVVGLCILGYLVSNSKSELLYTTAIFCFALVVSVSKQLAFLRFWRHSLLKAQKSRTGA